jgi:hypothetical protein
MTLREYEPFTGTRFLQSLVGVSQRRVRLTTFSFGDRDLLGFSIDICNGYRPERHQIDSGHQFGKERWQKFPVPTKEVKQNRRNTEIEHVFGGR